MDLITIGGQNHQLDHRHSKPIDGQNHQLDHRHSKPIGGQKDSISFMFL
jgi:hypothetical protein